MLAPVYDDFGNLLSGGGRSAMTTVLPADRIIVRKQGCWNCTSFDAAEIYTKRVADAKKRDVKVFLERGHGLQRAGDSAAITERMLLEKRGVFGVCLKGKVAGDFVACKHLCGAWSGRTGVTGSFTPGEGYDPLVEEMYEKIGDSAQGTPINVPLIPEKKDSDA